MIPQSPLLPGQPVRPESVAPNGENIIPPVTPEAPQQVPDTAEKVPMPNPETVTSVPEQASVPPVAPAEVPIESPVPEIDAIAESAEKVEVQPERNDSLDIKSQASQLWTLSRSGNVDPFSVTQKAEDWRAADDDKLAA